MQITSQIQDWHAEGMNLSAQYKRCEARMVEILSLMANERAYHRYQCDSLREYALYMWQLPENAAANLVTVANKALEVPELIEALKRGKVTVSKLRKICPIITQANARDWIELAEVCSTRIVEKAVAMEKPDTEMHSQMTYKSETIVKLEVDITEGLREKLERLSDLVSTKTKRSVQLHEVLDYLAQMGLERLDPVRRAKRHRARIENSKLAQAEAVHQAAVVHEPILSRDVCESNELHASNDRAPRETASRQEGIKKKKRERIKATLHHGLNLRDQAQCTHIRPDGTRCRNRRWLHVHHVKPVAHGGTNDLSNLVTACSGHHALYHH